MTVYVRARNGAFYRNPIVVFPEGFLCFDAAEPPELVLWGEKERLEKLAIRDLRATLEKRFGVESGFRSIMQPKYEQRVVPGSSPDLFQPAAAMFIGLVRRIPTPKFHEGEERRVSRVSGRFAVVDQPPHHLDAHQLEILD